ncbi:MAG: CBS domain-containing protein [Nitrososphaerales archaeon]|nr:CBS domain-containing protein [Nitrososphaerales archaeon]
MPRPKPPQAATRTRDLMQTPAVTVSEETTLDEAASILWEKNIGSVIIVNKLGNMAGILTERDMLFAVTKGLTGRNVPVSSIMSQTSLLASPNENVATVLDRMIKGGVRHLPVVDKDARPVGMISMRDLISISEPFLKFVLKPTHKKK